nr:ribonuclease H-like domain-containing protein [Tanacetum cinerariifolium]
MLSVVMAIGDPLGSDSTYLINNLDAGNPLFHQSNDNSSVSILNFKLVGIKNYKMWATAMKSALKVKNIMGLLMSELKETYDKMYGFVVFNLMHKINNLKRGHMEESHKVLHLGISGNNKSQHAAFVVKTNNNTNNFNRRVNINNNNTNEGPNPNLLCKNCDLIGHTIDSLRLISGIVLFDVLVEPEYNVSLLSLNKMIKDRKFFIGLDEHKCYIQDLKLGKIIGTGGLYLFDISKNGKFNTGMCNSVFICHASNEFWHYMLSHPTDQVLSILGKQFGFSKSDNISLCNICHMAKQTREPFPLSDHKSKSVGDIIHCDVWGPYKMVSKDGYRYFLTLVDNFSRAI